MISDTASVDIRAGLSPKQDCHFLQSCLCYPGVNGFCGSAVNMPDYLFLIIFLDAKSSAFRIAPPAAPRTVLCAIAT